MSFPAHKGPLMNKYFCLVPFVVDDVAVGSIIAEHY